MLLSYNDQNNFSAFVNQRKTVALLTLIKNLHSRVFSI